MPNKTMGSRGFCVPAASFPASGQKHGQPVTEFSATHQAQPDGEAQATDPAILFTQAQELESHANHTLQSISIREIMRALLTGTPPREHAACIILGTIHGMAKHCSQSQR